MRRALALLLLLVAASPAVAFEAGHTVVALQVGQGTGDFLNPEDGSGYISISRDTRGQVEAGLELWHLVGGDYAISLAAAVGTFRERNLPGASAAPTDPVVVFSTRGAKLRLGGDRYARLSPRMAVFAGPGLEWWSGRATYENVYTPAARVESATTTRLALSGRIGAWMAFSEAFGMTARVGTTLGYARAREAGARTEWWPVGYESAFGLTWTFGAE